jgi:CRISPR-associated protein Cmr3
MTRWLFHPRDALALRDGRQLWEASATVRSLEIPWPSTMAGAIRHRAATLAPDRFRQGETLDLRKLRSIAVRSGWLTAIPTTGTVDCVDLVPAPADCVWFRESQEMSRRIRIVPASEHPVESGRMLDGVSDLPADLEMTFPVVEPPDTKAIPGPHYWPWEAMLKWLIAPENDGSVRTAPPPRRGLAEGWPPNLDGAEPGPPPFGVAGLPHDIRTHTQIDPETLTAREGKLFRSDATWFERPDCTGWLSLGISCDDPSLADGQVALGGDRRVVAMRKEVLNAADATRMPLEPPPQILKACTGETRLRLILLTPGIFRDGYRPGHPGPLGLPRDSLVAAVVDRPEVISGWDMAARQPKHSCRMAPAGSVYWVDIPGGATEEWIRKLWLHSIAEDWDGWPDVPVGNDGFGLVLIGRARP